MESTQDVILAELRDLRSVFTANAQETGQRLSCLETDMKSIVGNGRKGRLESVEDDVKDLQRWRWRMLGICTGASGVVSVVGYLLFRT